MIKRNVLQSIVGAVLLVAIAGCVRLPLPSVKTGEPLDAATVKRMSPGKSTKAELFELLGAPKSIATRGRPMYLFHPCGHPSGFTIEDERILKLQAEPYFEIFSSENRLHDKHRVYFYYYAKSYHETNYLLFFVDQNVFMQMDRLWVLVDEEREIVDDIFFMPHRE